MKKKLRNQIFVFLLILEMFAILPSSLAAQNKIELEMGFFDLKAQSGKSSGDISSLGIYRIGYRHAVAPKIELGLGYTLQFTKIISGDSGFGLDLNASYFFLGSSNRVETKTENNYFSYEDDIRPFVSASFSQRNFQSIQTSYAGFGFAAGVEKTINEQFSGKLSAKYSLLSAGGNASAKEFAILIGLVFGF